MASVAGTVADASREPMVDVSRGLRMHPAITHALSTSPPTIARHAEQVIREMVHERLADPAPDAWRTSRLTGDGFPFEIAFSTVDDRLRFTLEPGRRDLDPSRRLGVALVGLRRRSRDPIPADVESDLIGMQSGTSSTFGAWVGCRIGQDGSVFKLYAETPDGATIPPRVACSIALPDRAVVRMLAYSPASRAFETYVRVPSLEPRHVPAILAQAGMEAEGPRLLEFVEDAYGHRLRGRLPGPSVGASYVIGGATPFVTLHFYARALWGSDARIRRGFERVGRALGWDPGPYLRVTAPVATREDWRTFHGILSISLGPSSPMSLTIGLRPVPW